MYSSQPGSYYFNSQNETTSKSVFGSDNNVPSPLAHDLNPSPVLSFLSLNTSQSSENYLTDNTQMSEDNEHVPSYLPLGMLDTAFPYTPSTTPSSTSPLPPAPRIAPQIPPLLGCPRYILHNEEKRIYSLHLFPNSNVNKRDSTRITNDNVMEDDSVNSKKRRM